jgi:hypothetical protein
VLCCSAELRANLEEQLRSQLALGMLPEDLKQQAEDVLRLWRVMPPAASALNRLVASIAATGRQEIFDRIAARLNEEQRRELVLPPDRRRLRWPP